jgi:hypothetical protein
MKKQANIHNINLVHGCCMAYPAKALLCVGHCSDGLHPLLRHVICMSPQTASICCCCCCCAAADSVLTLKVVICPLAAAYLLKYLRSIDTPFADKVPTAPLASIIEMGIKFATAKAG